MKMNATELIETLVRMKEAFNDVMQVEELDKQKLLLAVKESKIPCVSCYIDGITRGYDENGNWYENKNKGERLSYAPLLLNASSPLGWFMFYKTGDGWDIDKDIENAMRCLEVDEKCM